MFKVLGILFLVLFAGIIAITFSVHTNYAFVFNAIRENIAATFFADSSNERILREEYARAKSQGEKLKILIVPGHDDIQWGTEYRGLREADLAVVLAEKLLPLLSKNPSFEVTLSRTQTGYNPLIDSYLNEKKQEIIHFIKEQRALTARHIETGLVETYTGGVQHNSAPSRVVHILYGINKWANENNYDIILHVHFNDHPRKRSSEPGIYSGLTIYIPERQFSNSKGSETLAKSIYPRLSRFYPTSNLPKEDIGVVQDQELIAIGSNNSLNGAGLLIEYSYIYEPLLQDAGLRELAISDMALQTYLGIMDFFKEDPGSEGGLFKTRMLPYQWNTNVGRGAKKEKDVLTLQAALMMENMYPPEGFTKTQCPLSGNFGPCTEQALKKFQEKYRLPANGIADAQTRKKLIELYGN